MDDAIAAVDAWLAEDKTLDGLFPGWGRAYGRDYTARWGIADPNGVQRGELAFTVDRALIKPSIVVIMERRMIFRLDIVPDAECEPNPFGAQALGLPAIICGTHFHPWEANREWVRINGFSELPYRQQVPRALRTLAQGLKATADAVNITLSGEQTDCRLPAQGDLF